MRDWCSSSTADFQSSGTGANPVSRFCYNDLMSYETFGNFFGKTAEEVIHEVKKQKTGENVARAVLNPLAFAVIKGARLANGHPHDEETFIKAVILKTLKEKGLYPPHVFKSNLRNMMEDILKEERIVPEHPFWVSPLRAKKRKNNLGMWPSR